MCCIILKMLFRPSLEIDLLGLKFVFPVYQSSIGSKYCKRKLSNFQIGSLGLILLDLGIH